ncbi:MAG: 3-oxoadipate enol-lactonase [Paracoccaceae bacterium]
MQVLMRPWGHMHFVDQGPKDAPTILFANSLGTDLRMWQGVTDLLTHRCIRFDKRGHGLSATPATDWRVEDIADDAAALLDHLNIEKATFAGCSVGGMVAQAFGIHHAPRAHALILSNTAAKIGTPESWQSRISAVESSGIAPIADTILGRWFPKAFLASPDCLPWRTMLLRADPVGYVQTCRALSRADLRSGLAGLTLPALFLAGSEDQSTPPALVTETAALIAGAKLVELAGSGHIPAIDAPDTTARAITDFLGGLHG